MSLESDENYLSLPTENLRRYVSDAVLPDFSVAFPMANESQNQQRYALLSTEPNVHRKLEEIICLRNIWQSRVAKFCEMEIPSSPISKPRSAGSTRQRSQITIPSPSFRVEKFRWPPNLDEVESVNDATRAVFCTAERVISLLWPKRSEGFRFTDTSYSEPAPLCRSDHAIAAYSFYGRYGHHETSCIYDRTGIVIISMPCWVLSDHEMKEFTDCRTLPPFQAAIPGQEPLSFNKYQKIWAKLWDLCATRNSHLFILTNYHSWVFGAFQTPGLNRAKCSQVIDRREQSKSGSILKWVVFWFAAALNIRGTWLFSRSLSSELPDVCDKERMAPLDMHKVYTDPNGKFIDDVKWLKKIKKINTVEEDITFTLPEHPGIWFTKFTN